MGRSHGFTSVLLLAIVVSAPTAAVGQTRRPVGEEWNQVKPLFALVEQAAAGHAASADVTLAWQCHFLNAQAGVVFVPFTLAVERGELASFPIAMYVRVVGRGAPAPAPGPRDALAQYPFEDAAIVDRPGRGAHQPGLHRASRRLRRVRGPHGKARHGEHAPPKTVVLKQAVTVPDLQSHFTVSSIIVADKIEVDPRNRRPSFEEQLDEPYTLWGSKVTPAITNRFGRGRKLSLIFLVYNAAATAGDKPDVEVRYTFHRSASAGDTVFTATRPELFNAQTLGREFSLAGGDLIVAGQEMPLSRFPDGEYRLEISIIDNAAAQSIARDITFVVEGRVVPLRNGTTTALRPRR